jgi:flagellin
MVINTNTSAQTAANRLEDSSRLLAKSLARLSSGSKLLSPSDDAAGLAVSTHFEAQINRTAAAVANLGNALSFTQTQDGYLQQVSKALDRMSELAVQAQDVTKTNGDRGLYNKEFQALADYVNNVGTKDFNGVSLFDGNALGVSGDSEGGTFQIQGISGSFLPSTTQTSAQVPAPWSTNMSDIVPGFQDGMVMTHSTSNHGVTYGFISTATLQTAVTSINGALTLDGNMGSASYNPLTGQLSVTVNAGVRLYHQAGMEDLMADLGMHDLDNSAGSSPITMTSTVNITQTSTTSSAPDISTVAGAAAALTTIKSAINQVATDRATVGATMTRLNYTMDQLGVLKNRLSAANSVIKDVDVAQESTQYARFNILVQAGTAMLSQANGVPQSVLRLLG